MTRKTLLLSDGTAVDYLDQGQGEALVLIHGVGMRAEAWTPQIRALPGRIVALNLPGHGGSSLLAGKPNLTDYVRWATDALAGLNLGPINLAGHSMGALVAIGLAATQPEKVLRLAVLNAVHRRSAAARARRSGPRQCTGAGRK